MSPAQETPGPAYQLHRTDATAGTSVHHDDDMEYDSQAGSESYYNNGHDDMNSSVTGQPAGYGNNKDATETVHEMHLALLYLLSNPEEFKKALNSHPPRGVTTLSDWNAEYDDEESVMTSNTTTATPLPFVVFADDAEVVLPQAHTASQLFGIEQVEGIELEAAAGIPALSQLFLRWLALMPGGDHLNIIDPPGLTVMRIAGGRYRVTAAHRVVWTWMNEFASLAEDEDQFSDVKAKNEKPPLQVGDLVTLTIVDVFETDNQGKLLSYCPTFDNRKVTKTNQAAETLRKSSSKFFSMLGQAQKAVAKSEVNRRASAQLTKMGLMQSARNIAENMRHRVDEAVHQMNNTSSPGRQLKQTRTNEEPLKDAKGFEKAMSEAEAAATGSRRVPTAEELADSDVGVEGTGMAEI